MRRSTTVELIDGATTDQLMQSIVAQYPKLEAMLPAIVLALNEEYVTGTPTLREGDEVALIPPISGG
jgi:molybdopterin converting factor small subunit